MSNLPRVSLISASGAGGEFLFRMLDAIRPQAQQAACEVIVADRVGEPVLSRLREAYPWVDVVSVPRHADGSKPSVPELRAAAVERATGEIVAVLEEHCRPPKDWLQAIQENFQPEDVAIGGPILDDGWTRRADWVVYFSEYHNFLPPWPDGPRTALNGANVAYRRSALLKHREALSRGYWEVELHPKLAAEGRMRGLQALGAHHTGPFEFRYYLRQRYLLARVWGAMRRTQVGPVHRLAYLLGAPLFPFLLLMRIAARVRASGQFSSQFARALPLLIPVSMVYVAGEWMGYASGFGNALEEVE